MSKFHLLIFIIVLFGCSKKDHQENRSCVNYVGTHVVAGIRSSYTAVDVFKLMNSLHLKIESMSGFYYISNSSIDSATLVALLSSKPYINTGRYRPSVRTHYQTKALHITNTFWDMTAEHQKDWIETKRSLQLTEIKSDFRSVLLIVPAGKEKYWEQQLRLFNPVSWAELNCIGQIEPH